MARPKSIDDRNRHQARREREHDCAGHSQASVTGLAGRFNEKNCALDAAQCRAACGAEHVPVAWP
jgi:hypothetical protein